jgi:hypothetical protein
MIWDNLRHKVTLQQATESFVLSTPAYSEKISHEGAPARSNLNKVQMVGLTCLMPQTHAPYTHHLLANTPMPKMFRNH